VGLREPASLHPLWLSPWIYLIPWCLYFGLFSCCLYLAGVVSQGCEYEEVLEVGGVELGRIQHSIPFFFIISLTIFTVSSAIFIALAESSGSIGGPGYLVSSILFRLRSLLGCRRRSCRRWRCLRGVLPRLLLAGPLVPSRLLVGRGMPLLHIVLPGRVFWLLLDLYRPLLSIRILFLCCYALLLGYLFQAT